MPLVTLDKDGPLAIITFNNPPRGYMNAAQVTELAPLIDQVERDESVRAVIFTGAVPGVFIRHYDVSDILEAAGAVKKSGLGGDELMEAAKRGNPISRLFDQVDQMAKPTIAAINGFCQGGGFEFALCCDLRIAEAGDYRIGLPETNIGIFPGAGGTQRLPRIIGEARAVELILRGRTLPPEEAGTFGLVHEVTAAGQALTRAKEIGQEFARKSPRAVADAKSLVKNALTTPLEEGTARERGLFSRIISEDGEAERLMRDFLSTGEDINKV
ncbi:enoyl-CoA hydratase/isomerase family protein [Tepidicaulis sp. LMO-SS28]|uniref:enoyl-CoA hydratase/isomerase family protein n=1 Tax=Tepidicaulis sp. LMO-SS28 TaxID=3447455 RepID=UPI003EE13482